MEISIIKPELSIIQQKTYEIRGQKMMLDFDLAEMYQVETNQRNILSFNRICRIKERTRKAAYSDWVYSKKREN